MTLRDQLIARIEAGENTYALEQDIGNFFNPMYAGPSRNWPAYLNSLDAAVALCERVRPGELTSMTKIHDVWEVWLTDNGGSFLVRGDVETYGRAPTLPAALCVAALLRAEGE